jgi:hypothetical protein
MKEQEVTVEVYLDDGRVFEYEIPDSANIREHAYAIITEGYRRCDDGVFTWYPPYRIRKVKCKHPAINTKYPDRVRGT